MNTNAPKGIRPLAQVLAGVFLALALCGCGATSRHPLTAISAGKPERFRFAVYGDTRNGHAVHRKIVALILEQNPAFVLQTGDLVGSGSDPSLWATYDEITAPLRHQMTVYPARGNHDVGGTGYAEHVPRTTSGTKMYYSFDHGGSHFISLDTESPFQPGSAQYRWLANDLKAARQARHIFVFLHEPPYTVGPNGDNLGIRRDWCPLFRSYRVSAVFCGHDHLYYRTIRDGIPYVVTGGGGAPLYPVVNRKNEIAGDVAESTNHIVVCDVDGSHVSIRALRADGSVLDRFTIPAK